MPLPLPPLQDRTYVPQHRKLYIYDQGTLLFRNTVFRHPELKPRLQNLLLQTIAASRAGQHVDVDLMRGVLSILVDLGISTLEVYTQDFEQLLTASSVQLYHTQSQEVLAKQPCSGYLEWAESSLAAERHRADQLLHPSSVLKLMTLLERTLIAEHAIKLIEVRSAGGQRRRGKGGGKGEDRGEPEGR